MKPSKKRTRRARAQSESDSHTDFDSSSENEHENNFNKAPLYLSTAQAINKFQRAVITACAQPAFEHTTPQLTAMPAKCLPRFKKLPMELQDMVWLFALDDPLLEIFVQPGTGQFEATISKLAIMAYGRIYPVKPGLLPIYLTVNKEWTAREPKQKSLKKKKGKGNASKEKKELEGYQ